MDWGWLWDFDLCMDFYQDQELKANWSIPNSRKGCVQYMAFAPTSKGDLQAGRRRGQSQGWEGGTGKGHGWGPHAALHKASLAHGIFPMPMGILWFLLLGSRDPFWDGVWLDGRLKAQPQDVQGLKQLSCSTDPTWSPPNCFWLVSF